MKKILLIISLIALILFVSSCSYEDLGLGEAEQEEAAEPHSLSDITSEDLFFRLKTKQKEENPLRNINIRKAIAHAVDREKIAQTLLGEYGGVLDSLFNKDSPYYYPAWEQYDFNLQLAEEYIQKEGYGPDNPLYLTIGFSERSQAREKIAEIIREDLSSIGIYVWVMDQPSKDWYSTAVKTGDYEMGLWSLYNYDGSGLESYFSSQKLPPMETSDNKNCNNFYWYRSEDIDRILRDLSFAGSTEEKNELYVDLQKKLADDGVIIPLFSRLYAIAHNTRIENISISPENGSILGNLEDWTIDSAEEEETVVVGYEEEPAVINPFVRDTLYNRYINGVLFEGLWSRNSRGEYDNVLVREYSRVENQMSVATPVIKVKLLENIYWEDGSPIVSEDVYFTWKTVLESESLLGQPPGYGNIKDIEIIDDKEFNILFAESVENWQDLFSVVLPAEGFQEFGGEMNLHEDMVFGNGPYKLARWAKGEYILLERNDNYRGRKPAIEYLQFLFNSDINKLINSLKAGDIDVLSVPADLTLLEELEENPNLDLKVEDGNLWEHLAFCLKPKE